MKNSNLIYIFLFAVSISTFLFCKSDFIVLEDMTVGLLKDDSVEISNVLHSLFEKRFLGLSDKFKEKSDILAKKTFVFFNKFEKKNFEIHRVFLIKKIFYSPIIKNLFFCSIDEMPDGSLRELSHLIFCYDYEKNDFYRFRSFAFEVRKYIDDIYILSKDLNSFNQILKKRMRNILMDKNLLHKVLNLFVKVVLDENIIISDFQIINNKKSEIVLTCLLNNDRTKEEIDNIEIVLRNWRIESVKSIKNNCQ